MPDVTQLLNTDHRNVEELFTQFESTADFQLALQICEELTVHTKVEEEIVYPKLQQVDAELEREAEKEHDEADGLIRRIKAMSPGDPELTTTMARLKQAVLHHVREEETEAWPKLRTRFSFELDDMGRRVEQRKQQLITGEQTSSTSSEEVLIDLTKEELYEKAKEADIKGRSNMNKKQLAAALARTT